MLNTLLSIKIKNRIKQIEESIKNTIERQNKILKTNILVAKKTTFGKEHYFKDINSYTKFKKYIPIREYPELRHYIELIKQKQENILWPGKTKWFAQSSGTTENKSKFIPITKESLDDCHFKAGKDMLSFYCNNYPKSKIFTGRSLMIGGSTSISQFEKYYYGDLSAIIIKNLPIWVQLKRSPSIKTALLKDWEQKIEQLINETYTQNITSISGVPSWTMIIINKVLKKMDVEYLHDIWPNLELYMHGGISFDNYQKSFQKYIKNGKLNYLEIYNASEGFFGIQNEPNKSDLLLLIDHGIFYEFIPIANGEEKKDKIIPLQEVELNKIYAMVITTNAGLWRYKIGDTIFFTSLEPYKIKINGRIQSFVNSFGEELSEHHANQAIKYACQKTQAIVNEYIVAPLFYPDKTGAHEWFIEFSKKPINLASFNDMLDSQLKILNSDYEAKRYKNILLKPPIINVLKSNFFYDLLKNQNRIGGQNKIKRLHNNRKIIREIIKKS